METKELICKTAVKLFNEKGYDKVTLREIAKESNTTIGNLTHHFKKKEDLLMAIVSEIRDEYSFFFFKNLRGLELLEDLILSFVKAEKNKNEFKFYYQNIGTFAGISEQFKVATEEYQVRVYYYFLGCFATLQTDNIIKKEVDLETLHILAFTFTDILTNWSIHSSPFTNRKLRSTSVTEVLFKLIEPYVNEEYLSHLVVK